MKSIEKLVLSETHGLDSVSTLEKHHKLMQMSSEVYRWWTGGGAD